MAACAENLDPEIAAESYREISHIIEEEIERRTYVIEEVRNLKTEVFFFFYTLSLFLCKVEGGEYGNGAVRIVARRRATVLRVQDDVLSLRRLSRGRMRQVRVHEARRRSRRNVPRKVVGKMLLEVRFSTKGVLRKGRIKNDVFRYRYKLGDLRMLQRNLSDRAVAYNEWRFQVKNLLDAPLDCRPSRKQKRYRTGFSFKDLFL